MNVLRTISTLLFICILLVQSDAQKKSLFQFFADYGTEIPIIKIETDHKRLIKKKYKEEYQEGNIQFLIEDEPITLPIKIRARGNNRKKVCYYPPMKIDLIKGHLDSLGFKKKQDNLKLVVACKSNDAFRERLLMEHFIYELYSVVEPYHLKSKIVDLEFWKDGELKQEITAFLVEDENHYADRLGAKLATSGNVRPAGLVRSNYLKMCFFQYMIANTDWAVANKHNLEIVQVPEFNKVISIPYDFDYAGIINQPYAVPHETLPIKTVTERHFVKTKVRKAEALTIAKFYNEIRSDIFAKCDAALYLKEKTRKRIKEFIEDFYEDLETEKRIIKNFSSE